MTTVWWQNYNEPLLNIEINASKIAKAVDKLKAAKSLGPDCLHPKLITECKDVLLEPLEIIFKKSMENSELPDVWKQSNITAIYKNGTKTKAKNHRPISLTSVPGKLLEGLIRDEIVKKKFKCRWNLGKTLENGIPLEKCKHLHVGIHDINYDYTMEADQVHKIVDKVTSEKDLGVIMDMSLKFTEHINNKVNKAYRNVGLIFRTSTYMDTGRFLNLCKSIVRPHLEYALTVWSPIYNKNSAEGVIAPAGAKVTGASIRMWLLNKFISFLAVLTWKTGLKKCRQSA